MYQRASAATVRLPWAYEHEHGKRKGMGVMSSGGGAKRKWNGRFGGGGHSKARFGRLGRRV
jgi:hypothetical protein